MSVLHMYLCRLIYFCNISHEKLHNEMNITLLLSTVFKLDILFIFEGQAALLSGNAFMCPYYTDLVHFSL